MQAWSIAKFCFCTLALGDNYRALAKDLAKDLEQHSPKTPLLIFTDRPQDFSQHPNVITHKHHQQSVGCYHDKRLVLKQAIQQFPACIFIDADMRILSSVPEDLAWLSVPGIAARACESFNKRYSKVVAGTDTQKMAIEYEFVKKAATKFGLNHQDETVQFVYEYLFSLTRDSGKEIEFLNQWEIMAPYFELNGIYDGEGAAIALAAAKVGYVIRRDAMEGLNFFKERIERSKIHKGESSMEQMAVFFERQKKLEYPQRSLLQRAILKFKKKTSRFYRQLRLRVTTLKNYDFYYR
jgi:hypothetical protein